MDEIKQDKEDRELHNLKLTQFCVDNAAEAIFWLNSTGRFVYANNAAIEMLGYTREELVQMSVHQIDENYPEDDWVRHWDVVKSNKKMSFESVHTTKSGKKVPVEIKVSHMVLQENEIHCAFVRNISERKESELNLLKSKRRLRKTLDVTSDGVWDMNLLTGEVYYGAKWATVLGYKPEDLESKKIHWVGLLHPDDKEKTVQLLRRHLNGEQEGYEAEFRLRNSENKWQWIHARGKVIEFGEDGSPLRFVGTHTDITARKKLENNLLKSSEETKLFAYSVAHDLKNPAIAIRGLAERFRRKILKLDDEKKFMYCDRIIDSAEQLVDLVEKINDFISSKESKLSFMEYPLKQIAQDSKREFAAQLQYRSISWEVFQENPSVKVDRISMIRVLRNLVDNSLKYGGPNLSKIVIGYQNTPEYHVVSVRDNGAGVKAEDSDRIFQPFERKDTSAQQAGAGLGLAIVKEIAHSHKGEVWAEPNRKRGIKFCFAISKNL